MPDMPAGSTPRFAWYAPSFDPSIASIRLRCLAPIEALAGLGVVAERFDLKRHDAYDAVVFSKVYDEAALSEAETLRRAGKRVIFDICDNHFAGDENGDPTLVARSARLERMLRQASAVVVSTPTLGQQIAARVPEIAARLRIISDLLDEPAAAERLTLTERLGLWRLRRFLKRHAGALHLVWFGNNGADHMQSGFADLKRIQPIIVAFQRTHPVTLTVIANSRRRYRRLAARWGTPIRYLRWSRNSIAPALALHDTAIIPVSRNDFTLGKSINRPATALLAGLGVVANAIPSYEELRPFIALDDWEGGLRRYAVRGTEDRAAIAQAQVHLRGTYNSTVIGRLWQEVLEAQ